MDKRCIYYFKKGEKKGERCSCNVIYGGKVCWQHKHLYDTRTLAVDPQLGITALERQEKAIRRELNRMKLQAEECRKYIESLDESNAPNNRDAMIGSLKEMEGLSLS